MDSDVDLTGLSLGDIDGLGFYYSGDLSASTFQTPKYVGCWVVGGVNKFPLLEKPTDEQIKNTEQLLGWKWENN